MAVTRGMTAARRTKKQIYRSRVRNSWCRGKKISRCTLRSGCKPTKQGRRRTYCRKSTNRSA